MKAGQFLCEKEDAWVESVKLSVPNHKSKVVIKGMVDCLVAFEDGTFGIIDFKTSSVNSSIEMYSRQLHAYSFCIENAAAASPLPQLPISELALIVYEPEQFKAIDGTDDGSGLNLGARLVGRLSYISMEKNDQKFMQFLSDVLDVLESPSPPSPGVSQYGTCSYCEYLTKAKNANLIP
eukprot:CAMPEP_0182447092 /NCGR_PEP_ID=MMETSP1172-20130603/11291_1 /TAXON_ID=708627 /ORGANISM="Timspurckia oligopyrenoides, Strain CCMP3278" /LENGTH=178 /DNA_ID=CAMNT_0024643377 /DNA_START=382 /DNA_END=918 /DNA_ORIENTATION=-